MDTGYSPNNGEYSIQLGTPTTDNDSRQSAPQLVQLVAGSTVIGHVIVDSGHIIIDSGAITETNSAAILADLVILAGAISAAKMQVAGSVTANAGTNLNTSALALETGGNLATLAGGVSSSKYQINLANVLGAAISNTNPVNSSLSLGAAVAAYGSNPAATGIGTDVLYKWGVSGTTTVNHVSIQNNTAANVIYAFDAATTTAATTCYVLTPGQLAVWDRAVTALHVQTAAAQNFNGTSGISIEGYA